jgi:general nucleoside transport system permease protein
MTQGATAEARERPSLLEFGRDRRHVGIAGIALGVIAVWLSLPPVTVQTLIAPLLVAAAAVAAGVYAILGEERRVGWGAVAAGVTGAAGAALAQQ